MTRLKIIIPLVLAIGTLAAFGTWYWQAAEAVAETEEFVPSRIESRRLEVDLGEQRRRVGTLESKLDAGLRQLDGL